MKIIRPVEEIFEDVKDIICWDIDGKVLDHHAAEAIGLTPMNYATKKKRNTIPYEELATFCFEKRISLNWLLFRDGAKEISYAQSA